MLTPIKSSQPLVPIDLLRTGEVGRISEIDGDTQLAVRLAEMGLQPGAEVRMVRAGRPCIIAINNHRVSLRANELASILVVVNPPDALTRS